MNYLGVLFNFLNIYKVFSRPCKALLLHPEWSDIFEVLYGDWLKLLAREQRVKCDTRWKHSQKTTSRSLFWCLHCELRAYFMQYSGSTQKEKNRKALKRDNTDYMDQGIQEWIKQNLWKTASKKLEVIRFA